MNTIGATPSQNLPNLVTPFTPPGMTPAGLENTEAKNSALPPVEQSAQSFRTLNRRPTDDQSLEDNEPRPDDEAVTSASGDEQITPQQAAEEQEKQAVIRQLAARDREVRQHEAAHAAVGGALAGAPQFQYVRGPDGVLYAQSGEVPISLPSSSGDPQQVVQQAEQVQRAALAPAEPSPQDRSVAAQAAQIAQQARAELAAQNAAEARGEPAESDSETEPAGGAVSAEEKARQEEARAEELREKEARREEARRAANAERFIEIQNTPLVPVNDLTQRILGLGTIEQSVKVGSVLDKLV